MISPEELTYNRIVVDTDVFSFVFRKDDRAHFFNPYMVNRTLALSFMSVAELYYGAYKAGWGTNSIARLENAIKLYVILPYDYLVCQKWASVRRQREIKGLSMSHSDSWVAACALRHDCPLLNNNGVHFKDIDDLVVISPTFI